MAGFLFFGGLGLALGGVLGGLYGLRLGFLMQAVGFTLFGLLFYSRGDGFLTVGCAYMAAVSLTDAQDDDDQGERRRRRAPARR